MSKEKASANAIAQAINEAEALWKEGQRKEAIGKLEAACSRFGDDLDILRRLVWMYFHYLDEANAGQKIVDLCLEILRIEPEDVETRLLLAEAYWLHLVDYEKAAEEYRKAIEIDPSNVEAYVGIAGIYPDVSAEEALEALQKAIELQPDRGDLYARVAQIYRFMGEYEKELQCLEKALEKGVDMYTGDREKELEWLEKVREKGTYAYIGGRRRIEQLKEKLKKG